MRKHCPRDQAERLTGKLWDTKRGRYVFRTKLAQEYPHLLRATIGVHQLWTDDLAHLAPSFALQTAAADRKRPLGLASRWKEHRQAVSTQKALESGYQLKRGALKPLLEVEMEPGQAIHWALNVVLLWAILGLKRLRLWRARLLKSWVNASKLWHSGTRSKVIACSLNQCAGLQTLIFATCS